LRWVLCDGVVVDAVSAVANKGRHKTAVLQVRHSREIEVFI
jgi:hypothetical protein